MPYPKASAALDALIARFVNEYGESVVMWALQGLDLSGAKGGDTGEIVVTPPASTQTDAEHTPKQPRTEEATHES